MPENGDGLPQKARVGARRAAFLAFSRHFGANFGAISNKKWIFFTKRLDSGGGGCVIIHSNTYWKAKRFHMYPIIRQYYHKKEENFMNNRKARVPYEAPECEIIQLASEAIFLNASQEGFAEDDMGNLS